MTLLETSRSRILVAIAATAAPAFASILCLLLAQQGIGAQAAGAEDVGVMKAGAQIIKQVASGPAPHPGATPVVVELFTSEGCSSCPPADALLARLDHDQPVSGANIIVLGEHVDYWDSLGWRDRFSSAYLTQRQRDYQASFQLGDIYTPQTVVNGSMQFNGSDGSGIRNAIAKAAAGKAYPLQFGSVKVDHGRVSFTLLPGPPLPKSVALYAALVDPSDTTEVREGENKGRTLHHAGVVRCLSLEGGSREGTPLGRQPFSIQAPGLTRLDGTRLVVFTQIKPAGPIVGAVACTVGPAAATVATVAQTLVATNRCPAATI